MAKQMKRLAKADVDASSLKAVILKETNHRVRELRVVLHMDRIEIFGKVQTLPLKIEVGEIASRHARGWLIDNKTMVTYSPT